MRKVAPLVFCVVFISCSTGVLKQNEIDQWLTTVSGAKPAEIDVSGKWRDGTGQFLFGWGKGYLRQEKDSVRGTIGNYNVRGVVSGKNVYLVFVYGGEVYYTPRPGMIENGVLAGNYFKADDREQTKGYPTSLVKSD
jgi:hypothetical protein